jgi:hypothetical protein
MQSICHAALPNAGGCDDWWQQQQQLRFALQNVIAIS